MLPLQDVLSDYEFTTTRSIIGYARDYFKDTFGFRPESIQSDSDTDIRAHYIGMIIECDEYLIKNRDTRKNNGWDE